MKKRIVYADEDLGDIEVVDDFLPSPEHLAFKEDNIKITLSLSRKSVEFFKQEARRHHTRYQSMIRRLLDIYTDRHSGVPLTKGSKRPR